VSLAVEFTSCSNDTCAAGEPLHGVGESAPFAVQVASLLLMPSLPPLLGESSRKISYSISKKRLEICPNPAPRVCASLLPPRLPATSSHVVDIAIVQNVEYLRCEVKDEARVDVLQIESCDVANASESVTQGAAMDIESIRRLVITAAGVEVTAQGLDHRFNQR